MNIRLQNALITNFVYTSFPTGIGFLAGYLRKYNSADITVIDEHIRSVTEQKLIELLGQLACPRIVGLSCLTVTLKRGLELAGKIKRYDSEKDVLLKIDADGINSYISSLPLDTRHWIQMLGRDNVIKKIILYLMPRLEYAL